MRRGKYRGITRSIINSGLNFDIGGTAIWELRPLTLSVHVTRWPAVRKTTKNRTKETPDRYLTMKLTISLSGKSALPVEQLNVSQSATAAARSIVDLQPARRTPTPLSRPHPAYHVQICAIISRPINWYPIGQPYRSTRSSAACCRHDRRFVQDRRSQRMVL